MMKGIWETGIMTQKKAEILLAAVIAARATSLLFSKIA